MANIKLSASQVNQIYSIVNEVNKVFMGSSAPAIVDTTQFVSAGSRVLNTLNLDLYLNTLVRRIGYTYENSREYSGDYLNGRKTNMEWGAIVQKLTALMPEAEEDQIYNVGKNQGKSIDQYVINLPQVRQMFFEKEAPYAFHITTQTVLLEEAFINESSMLRLLNSIMLQVKNRITLTRENLGRLTLASLLATATGTRRYPVVTMYNNIVNPPTSLTPNTAITNPDFLRFFIAVFEEVSDQMERFSTQFNAEGFERFTTKKDQNVYMLSAFKRYLETVVQYSAFNKEYVEIADTKIVPYWQAPKYNSSNTPSTVTSLLGNNANIDVSAEVYKEGQKVKENIKINGLIAAITDDESWGYFRDKQRVYTTPINASAAYYNTFWHENQLFFTDQSENYAIFVLE